MRRKKQVLQFLEDNHCMINSLMSSDERKSFNEDIVSIIEDDIKKQIEKEKQDGILQSKVSEE